MHRPGGARQRNSGARALARAFLALALAVHASAQGFDDGMGFFARRALEPEGRLVWTVQKGNDFTLATHLFAPPGTPAELILKGVVRVDESYFLDSSGTELKEAGKVDEKSPKADLRFLHPALDHTGKRLLWIGGPSWGPESVPGAKPKENPDGKVGGGGLALHFGKPGNALTRPAEDGAVMDGFPVVDPEGKWIYFARFFYDNGPAGEPGWHLMRYPFEQPEAARPEPVMSPSGIPVMGLHPVVSTAGNYLYWVRPDPDNVGSDIWYMSLEPPTEPTLLVPGEGPYPKPFRGSDPTASASDGDDAADIDSWMRYSLYGGKARISRPSVSSDGSFLAYATDRDGDWDLYVSRVEETGPGQLRWVEELPVLQGPVRDLEAAPGTPEFLGDGADDSWPVFSGDSKFLAYMSDRTKEDPFDRGGGESRIWVVGVEATGGPPDYHKLAPAEAGLNQGAMWPYWDQDEDPPHVLVTVSPEGGGDPMVLKLVDQEPDATTRSDVVSMSLQIRDYHRDVPPPGEPTPADLAPIQVGAGGPGSEPAARLEYPTDTGLGNSLFLLLSGARENLGPHMGLGKFKVPTGVAGKAGTAPFAHPRLTSPDFDGLWTFENVRLKVDVLARDNRWLRVGVPKDLARTLYPDGKVPPASVEVTHMLRHDPRAMDPLDPKPPYLKRISRNENLERHYPGITWWVEEMAHGGQDGAVLAISNENAPYLIFRAANHPVERYPDSRELYLRIVVRDLMSNVSDLRIPIHVRPKDFAVDTLQIESRRKDL